MLKGLLASSGLRGLIGSANRSSSVSTLLSWAGAPAPLPPSMTALREAMPPGPAGLPRPAPPEAGVKAVILRSAAAAEFFVSLWLAVTRHCY